MQVTFKDAGGEEAADEKVLIDLWGENFKACWLSHFWKKKRFRRFSQFLTQKCGWKFFKYWLILSDDKPIGFVLITFGTERCPQLVLPAIFTTDKNPATIHEVYIRQEFRGRGVGKRTRLHVEHFCNEQNLRLSFPNNREWRLFEEEL